MRLASLVAVLVALAGCSGGGDNPVTPEAPAATTGDLHGVVVDAAIRPLDNVTVRLEVSGEAAREMATGLDGRWAFTGLPPGSALVAATRAGYLAGQTTALVAAGVGLEAEGVRIVLDVDPATVPAIEAFLFDGYLACSVTAVVVRQACDADEALRPVCDPTGACGELSDDRFLAAHTLGRSNLAWLQSELQWTASGVGDRLRAVPGARDPATGAITDFSGVDGAAPLIVTLTGDVANALGIGAGKDYALRVFSSDAEGTTPPCAPSPVGCTFGVGAAYQQQFTVVTHAFYGFTPPEGWQFGRDGLPAVPPP